MGYFGRTLEAELEKAGSDAKNEAEAEWKRKKILSDWLGEDDKPQRGVFADPAALLK